MGEEEKSVCSKPVESVHVNEWKTFIFMVQDQHEHCSLKSLWDAIICCRFLVDIMMQQDVTETDAFLSDSLKLAGPRPYTRSHGNCSC